MAGVCLAPVLSFALDIAVPSYFYPGAPWERMASASNIAGLCVMNPNSGPGASLAPAYAAQVKKTQAAGLRVLGYVSTRFGTRPSAEVKSDIDLYYSWYAVDGIFLDEAATSCVLQPSYFKLNRYIKRKSSRAITILNFGTGTQECYLDAGDIIVNFEGTYKDYLQWSPTWEKKYSASRFWNLIYAAPSAAECDRALQLAIARNAGWVYVTQLDLPNPWEALPAYWESEVANVQRIGAKRKRPLP